VARAVWRPRPDFTTSAEAWLTAGGAHHTVLSTAIGVEAFRTYAELARTELLVIDETTTRERFADQVRWNQAYYRLAAGV
jgi:L-arabinose isomerase